MDLQYLYQPQTTRNAKTSGGNQDHVWNLHHITTLSVNNIFSLPVSLPSHLLVVGSMQCPRWATQRIPITLKACFLFLLPLFRHCGSSTFISGCYRPLSAGSAGTTKSLHSSFRPFSPISPSTENEEDSEVLLATSVVQTQVCWWLVSSVLFLNYVVDKLKETLRQVLLNSSYCGSLKCEPTENDRDTHCIHEHRLLASETELCLRLGKDTIQSEDRSCNNKHHNGRVALK